MRVWGFWWAFHSVGRSIGIENIAAHDQRLVTKFVEGLDSTRYDLLSPGEGAMRSTLVFISHKDPARNIEER